MKTVLVLAALIGLGIVAASGAHADDRDKIARGSWIFSADCVVCHDDSLHILNDSGPGLYGVVGRRVGSLGGYAYSPALRKANAAGDRWTPQRLKQFLANPEAMYSGTDMPMNFSNPEDRSAIVAYLKTLKPKY